MLKTQVFPAIINDFGDEIPIFMQDNTPIHKPAIVKEYLENQDVALIDWPVKGADLNPVENVWAHLQYEFLK